MDERKVEKMCQEEAMFTMQKLLEMNKEIVTDDDISDDDLPTVCMIWKSIKEIKTVLAMDEGANWLKGR
jgi:hypothetical protein